MFNITADALKWLFDHMRPRWLWGSIILAGVTFSIWDSLPDPIKLRLVNAVVPPNESGSQIDIEVAEFKIDTEPTSDLVWLKNKIERNLVELFVSHGKRTAHSLAILTPDGSKHPRIAGTIEAPRAGEVEVSARLEGADGALIASTSLEAPLEVLKENYKSLPEALVFGMDVSPVSLRPLRVKEAGPPTTGSRALAVSKPLPLSAMLLYFEARRKAGLGESDTAIAKLQKALEIDANFAMAHWAIGELLDAQGKTQEAAEARQRAKEINLDHPRMPISPGMARPVPEIVTALKMRQWEEPVPGYQHRRIDLSSYGLTIEAWRFDAGKYGLHIAMQKSPDGSSVKELRAASGAVLVVNGGFFEVDQQQRLTPSGFLVTGGTRLGAYRAGAGSAVLFQRKGQIDIGWSKDWESLTDVEEAVQAGPMVIDPGGSNGIKSNDFNRLNRTALCVTGSKITAVIVTGGLSLFELGEVLATPESDGGFGCDRAINLDGGPSSQASASIAGKSREIEGTWRVQNGIAIVAKQ